MTMGAPITDVTALMGNDESHPGKRAMRLHRRLKVAPNSNTAGSRILWLEVLKNVRAK
jgi:hypothetical protein